MKRLLLFAVVATLFAACSKDAINEQQNMQTILDEAPETLVVGFEEGDETRIQLNEAQKTVWNSGDEVSVFYKSDANQKYEYRGETGARTAELHKVSAGSSTTKMGYVVVAYPYNEEYVISPATGNLETMLPATQHYAVDSYGVGNNLMVAQSEFTQFSLKSVCGWLKLQLTGNGEVVKGIKFRGNNGEQVAGLIHVDTKSAEATLYSEEVAPDDNGNANGSLVIDGAMATEVMLYCDEGVTLSSEATAFYIALPPQTFEEGFTVDVICTDGTMMAKSSDKRLSIERNHIQPMAAFEFAATGTTDVPTEPENPVNPNLPSNENNKIYYTTTDGKKMFPYKSDGATFGAILISNIYQDGVGVMTFDDDVTTIGYEAFCNCTSLTSVNIPDSVTTIGESAFCNCDSLTSVNIPDSVTTIGEYAFSSCGSLTSVNIPDSVTKIGEFAFRYCDSLTSVYCYASIPPSLGIGAFDYNASGRRIYVYEECVELYKSAWSSYKDSIYTNGQNCPDTTTIEYTTNDGNTITPSKLPIISNIYENGVGTLVYSGKQIPNDAFRDCDSLASVTIGDSVTSIGDWAFSNCTSMTSVNIPDSVTTIGYAAFYECDSLISVNIPNSVTTIGDGAFAECDSLTSVYCKATTPPALGGTYVFDNNGSGRKIYVPAGSVEAYKSAEGWKGFADYIVGYNFENGEIVPGQPNTEIWYTNGSTTEPSMIRDGANFGANIVSNTYDADKKCWVIKFDGDVTTVGCVLYGQLRTIFTDCSSLTSISIPNSVTTIKGSVFKGCTSLTSITIPESVTEIGWDVFQGCSSLKEFKGKFASEDGCCLIINGVLDQFAINCGATEYTIPDNVISIDYDAFNGCSSITSITIPDTVEGFNVSYSNPFYNCSNLKEFKGKFASEDGLCLIDDGNRTIISFAIGCGKTSYSFVEYNMAIGNGAVANCQSITDVACSQMIYGSAFAGCKNLSHIVIATPTQGISDYAFASCPNLINVTVLPGTPPYLGGDNIFSDSPNVKIFVYSGFLNAYKSAWSSYSSIIFAL